MSNNHLRSIGYLTANGRRFVYKLMLVFCMALCTQGVYAKQANKTITLELSNATLRDALKAVK